MCFILPFVRPATTFDAFTRHFAKVNTYADATNLAFPFYVVLFLFIGVFNALLQKAMKMLMILVRPSWHGFRGRGNQQWIASINYEGYLVISANRYLFMLFSHRLIGYLKYD